MFNFLKKNKKVVTRFAPSPTGFLHIGGVRTALFSYLYAKQRNGKYVLRIEDTDKARSKVEWADGLVDDLNWLGLIQDELYIQSKNLKRHQTLLKQLIEEDKAYISKEVAKDGGGEIKDIIRFRNPNKKVVFKDLIRGEIINDTTDLGDFVIARNMEEPIFHFAVVIDDHDEGVTHVIRAEEHISNTPRQILIIEALGWTIPEYGHIPLILASDKSKISKRKHGETVSLTYYRERGYLPEAIINFVAMIGWNPGDDREIFSLEELIKNFNIVKVQKSGGVFNIEKLNWYNKYYLGKLSFEGQKEYVKKFISPDISKIPQFDLLVPVIMERINCGVDILEAEKLGEYSFYINDPVYDANKLIWKQSNREETRDHLEQVLTLLSAIDNSGFSGEIIKATIWKYTEENGRGNVLWPIRYALSGIDKSPDPFTLASILGKDKTLARLKFAYEQLQ